MMKAFDTATVTISVTGIQIICLKKLSLVSHALAEKIGGAAGREQSTLASTLDDLVRQIELRAAGVPSPATTPRCQGDRTAPPPSPPSPETNLKESPQ